MRVSQIMTSPAITIDKDFSLADAISLLEKHVISRLIVVKGNEIVGIITEKDIAKELGSTKSYRIPPSRMRVSSVMSANPITVAPDVMAKRAAEIMLDNDISGLPVVSGGELQGIITKMDFAKVCVSYDDIYVGHVMEPHPVTVSPTDRLIHARKILLEENIVGLPVVEAGELVGIITVRDVAMRLADFQDVVPDKYKTERIRNLLVGDVMSKPTVAAKTDDELSKVAKIMLERRFSSLPVVNLKGEVVGLITKTELTEIARQRL